MSEIIHVHVYDPSAGSIFGSTKNDKSEVHTYTCDKTAVCDAYKNGKCIIVCNPFGPRCFGRKSVSTGPTRRARSFRDFVNKGKSHEKYGALTTQTSKMFKIGSGYFMPYAHINLGENTPFAVKSSFMSAGVPYLEEPTPENLSKIYKHRPHAMFGGEITDYQKKVVPQIVKHMHDCYPELYRALIGLHPEAGELVENFDYTGKKAVLETLSPGKMKIGPQFWDWDGQYLTGPGSHMIFVPASATDIRLTPKKGATVEITNTDMVNENTVITD